MNVRPSIAPLIDISLEAAALVEAAPGTPGRHPQAEAVSRAHWLTHLLLWRQAAESAHLPKSAVARGTRACLPTTN